MARSFVIGASLVAHVGLLIALDRIEVKESHAATAIEVVETTKEKPKPPETKVEPPPPEPPKERARNTRPAEAAPPPPDAPTPPTNSSPLDALPDFGLELGGSGGPGGFAIAQGTGPRNAAPRPVQKTLSESAAPKPEIKDSCAEGPAKPKLIKLPQPNYTDAARAAGIEGKVRVQITVDESGQVVDAKVLSSLGHGLDESALAAAKAASFEAAVRCGKPTRSTFTVSIRFTAS